MRRHRRCRRRRCRRHCRRRRRRFGHFHRKIASLQNFLRFVFFFKTKRRRRLQNFFCSLFRFSKDDDAADLETAFRLSEPEFEFSRLFAPSY